MGFRQDARQDASHSQEAPEASGARERRGCRVLTGPIVLFASGVRRLLMLMIIGLFMNTDGDWISWA